MIFHKYEECLKPFQTMYSLFVPFENMRKLQDTNGNLDTVDTGVMSNKYIKTASITQMVNIVRRYFLWEEGCKE